VPLVERARSPSVGVKGGEAAEDDLVVVVVVVKPPPLPLIFIPPPVPAPVPPRPCPLPSPEDIELELGAPERVAAIIDEAGGGERPKSLLPLPLPFAVISPEMFRLLLKMLFTFPNTFFFRAASSSSAAAAPAARLSSSSASR
jgi:hypothetical protein